LDIFAALLEEPLASAALFDSVIPLKTSWREAFLEAATTTHQLSSFLMKKNEIFT